MERVNRAITLLHKGEPVYYTGITELSYERGRESRDSWADYLCIDLEHQPFSMPSLREFMRGLSEEGEKSGPAVIVTLPTDGTNEAMVRNNSWMIKQVLATGVHGLMLCHVESPDAVKAFVEASRYSHQTLGVGDVLGQGRRGSGGQDFPAAVWKMSTMDYLDRADVWPLNPNGELMLGIKIENHRALAEVEASVAVPGIAFAEWGPGDMGLSLGYKEAHDPPYPTEMLTARHRVKAACDSANVAFLDIVEPTNVKAQIDDGVRICAATAEAAEIGRQYLKQ